MLLSIPTGLLASKTPLQRDVFNWDRLRPVICSSIAVFGMSSPGCSQLIPPKKRLTVFRWPLKDRCFGSSTEKSLGQPHAVCTRPPTLAALRDRPGARILIVVAGDRIWTTTDQKWTMQIQMVD